MSLIRYYVGKLDLAPRWDARVEDVLSAAMSVAKIDSAQNSRGRNYFYVVFSASDFRHVLDVMRVFRANGIVGTLCYKDVVNSAGKPQKMLALRVRDRGPKYFIRLVCEKPGDTQGNLLMFQLPVYDGGQKFIRDVQNTIGDVTYYRDTVLPEYNEAHKNKRYIFQELFGKFR